MATPIPFIAESSLEIYNVQGGKQLLREYSGVPDAEVDTHAESIVSLH